MGCRREAEVVGGGAVGGVVVGIVGSCLAAKHGIYGTQRRTKRRQEEVSGQI